MSTTFWEKAWRDAQPKLSSIRESINSWPRVPSRILRVGQLDAELLDQELLSVLKEPVNKALGQIKSVYETRYDAEVSLVVAAILYKLSVWDQGATYGAKLQDLRFRSRRFLESRAGLSPSGLPRKALAIHAGLTVLIPYLHTRIRTHALSRAWPDAPSADLKRRAWDLLTLLEALHSTLGLAGFVVFLYDGRYRSIADRLLGLRLVAARPIVTRNVSYEFMNRQMVWHSFTEFLIFLLPLLNTRAFRKRISRLYTRILTPIASLALAPLRFSSHSSTDVKAGASSSSQGSQHRGKYWSLPEDQCAICAENASYSISNITSSSTTDVMATAYAASSASLAGASVGQEADVTTGPPAWPITTPYVTSCGHVYCYFCLSERMIRAVSSGEDDGLWECLRCQEPVQSCERAYGAGEEDDVRSEDGISDLGTDSVLGDEYSNTDGPVY